MASLIRITATPTLTQLYRSGQILASSAVDLSPGIQAQNDKICTIQQDITKLEVDSIVNAANGRLLGGGGVDGAIHRAAGYLLLRECRTLGGCATGSAKVTDAYDLPCKKVIHAVGPIYETQDESEPLLRGCYRTALQLAVDNNCKSIAFSAISTGIYGYPSEDAAAAALDEVKKFLEQPDGEKLDKVIFCNFMKKDVDAYAAALPFIFPATAEDRKRTVRSIWETSETIGEAQSGDEPSIFTSANSMLEPSITKITSSENTVAQSEGSTDSNHASEQSSKEDRTGRAAGSSDTDRDQLIASVDSGSNRTTIEPDNLDRRNDSRGINRALNRQNPNLDGETLPSRFGEMGVGEILVEQEPGMDKSKDVVGDTHVEHGQNLPKSTKTNATEAAENLPDEKYDVELPYGNRLENSAEIQDGSNVLAGKFGAMNVSVREVRDGDDKSEAV